MKCHLFVGVLACLALVGCKGSGSGSGGGYTKTLFQWEGARAEQIREELIALPLLRLAIVNDGEALLYHEAPLEQVVAELEQAEARWAMGVSVGEVRHFEGRLPAAPEVEPEPRMIFHANRDAMRRHGISFSELARQSRGWLLEAGDAFALRPEVGNPEVRVIIAPNGHAIPLEELGEIQVETVMRPLVIEGGR